MRCFHAMPLAFVVFAVVAQAERSQLKGQTIDQLKIAYLDCDRRASVAMLDFADAANCSMVHEELKQRGFGGDWSRMLAWWKSAGVAAQSAHRREADVAAGAAPMPPVEVQ